MGKLCLSDSLCFKTENILLVFISILIGLYFVKNTAKEYNNVLQQKNTEEQVKLQSLETKLNLLEGKTLMNGEKNLFEKRITDPLVPPFQTYPGNYIMRKPPGIPINIPTRGFVPNYQQIGVLNPDSNGSPSVNELLPLYGKPTYPGSNQWNYYTNTNGYNPLKLPVFLNGKNCTEEYGCKQLFDVGDKVKVEGGGQKDYTIGTLYKYDTPRYIPFV